MPLALLILLSVYVSTCFYICIHIYICACVYVYVSPYIFSFSRKFVYESDMYVGIHGSSGIFGSFSDISVCQHFMRSH